LNRLTTLPAPDVLTILTFSKIRHRQGRKKRKGKKKRQDSLVRVKDGMEMRNLATTTLLMKDYFDDLNRTVSFGCWNKSS